MKLTEREKRELADAGQYSGAYKSMCWSNPIRDFDGGFVIDSTDRNYDNIVVRFDKLNDAQKDLVSNLNPKTF